MARALATAQDDLFVGRTIHEQLPSFRDDLDIMSLPFFSIEKKRSQPLEYERQTAGKRTYIRVSPGEFGLATIWDNDLLIYIRTLIIDALNREQPVGKRVRFHVHDYLRSTGRTTSGREYEAFKASLMRLKTTTVMTNITTTDRSEDQAFGWIESYKFTKQTRKTGDEIMASCEVVVSDWLFTLMTSHRRALALDPVYFGLTGGLARKLYTIVRKHLGEQANWAISVENLRDLCGVRRAVSQFRYDLAKIVAEGLPGFHLELTTDYARIPLLATAGGRAVGRKGARAKEYLLAAKARPQGALV